MTTLAQDRGGVVRLLEKATFGVLRADGHKDWFQPTVMLHSGDDIVARYHHGAPDFTCTVGKYEYELRNAEAIEAAVNFLRAHSAEIARALEQLRDLHDSIRTVYDAVPALPITADTMDAATDALHAFCLLVGIHRVDVGDPQPQPAMQQGGGGGDHG